MYSSIFFFGSHPALSLAELSCVCETWLAPNTYTITSHNTYAILTSETQANYAAFMKRLGGTVKIAECIEANEDTLIDWIAAQLPEVGKNRFGVSVYSAQSILDRTQSARRVGMSIKRGLQEKDRSVRFVQSNDPTLSAVVVTKEHLIDRGADICLVREKDQTLFARTVAVQDFESFSTRDYGRPARDHRSGMLPPKLAQMMINLAQPKTESRILDPFCGSGTILQEALLMDLHNVAGSDISPKAIDDTKKNLEWLKLPVPELHIADAEELDHHPRYQHSSFDAIICEGNLGKPSPRPHDIPHIVDELTDLYTHVLPVLQKLLTPHGRIVIALPFWRIRNATGKIQETHLPLQKMLKTSGLRTVLPSLFYFRPESTVGREILVLTRYEKS